MYRGLRRFVAVAPFPFVSGLPISENVFHRKLFIAILQSACRLHYSFGARAIIAPDLRCQERSGGQRENKRAHLWNRGQFDCLFREMRTRCFRTMRPGLAGRWTLSNFFARKSFCVKLQGRTVYLHNWN